MTEPFPVFETFSGREGEAFEVSGASPDQAVTMTLSRVDEWGPVPEPGKRRPFTILFHGPVYPALPQSIYHFEHAAIGDLDMFIVPLGPDDVGMRYEAVFS